MDIEVNVIDAFTNKRFGGNPAAVVITDSWLSEELMQNIASENNLSETAFLIKVGENEYSIRWFSPLTEISFCGHATLASAFVLFGKLNNVTSIKFLAKAVGELWVEKTSSGKVQMNFPGTKPKIVDEIPCELIEGLSIEPTEVYQNSQAYFAIYNSEEDVLNIKRDNELLKTLKPLDVVVTAISSSEEYDFVSRYFWPANGGDEDPVTGSIHTGLAPFWSERLGKIDLVAYQASARGGILECKINGDRVLVSGNAVQYMRGTITV